MSKIIKNFWGKETGIRHSAQLEDTVAQHTGPKFCGICQEGFQNGTDDYRINDCNRCITAGYNRQPDHWRKVFAAQKVNTLGPDMQALANKLAANKVKLEERGMTRAAASAAPITSPRSVAEIQANKTTASLETIKEQVMELLPSIFAELGLSEDKIELVADMIVPTKINQPIRHNTNAKSAVRSIVLEALSSLGTADELLKREAKLQPKGTAKSASVGDTMLQEGMHRVSAQQGSHFRTIPIVQTAWTKEVTPHDQEAVEVAPAVQVPDNATNGLSTNDAKDFAGQFHQTNVLSGGIIPYTDNAGYDSIPNISDVQTEGIKRIRSASSTGSPQVRSTRTASKVEAPTAAEYFKFANKLTPSLPVENLTGKMAKEARQVVSSFAPVGTVTAAFSDQSEKSWSYYLTDKGALFLGPDTEFHAINPRAFLSFVQTDPTFMKWAALPPQLEQDDDDDDNSQDSKKGPMNHALPTGNKGPDSEDETDEAQDSVGSNEDNAVGEQADNDDFANDSHNDVPQPNENSDPAMGGNDPQGGGLTNQTEFDISHLLGPNGEDQHLPPQETFENPDHPHFDPNWGPQPPQGMPQASGVPNGSSMTDDSQLAAEMTPPPDAPPQEGESAPPDNGGGEEKKPPFGGGEKKSDDSSSDDKSKGGFPPKKDDSSDDDDDDTKDDDGTPEKREAILHRVAMKFLPHIEASFADESVEGQLDLALATAIEYLEPKFAKTAASRAFTGPRPGTEGYDPSVDHEVAKGKGAGAYHARLRLNEHTNQTMGPDHPLPFPEAHAKMVAGGKGGRPVGSGGAVSGAVVGDNSPGEVAPRLDRPKDLMTPQNPIAPGADFASDDDMARIQNVVQRSKSAPVAPGVDPSKSRQDAFYKEWQNEFGYPHPEATALPGMSAPSGAAPMPVSKQTPPGGGLESFEGPMDHELQEAPAAPMGGNPAPKPGGRPTTIKTPNGNEPISAVRDRLLQRLNAPKMDDQFSTPQSPIDIPLPGMNKRPRVNNTDTLMGAASQEVVELLTLTADMNEEEFTLMTESFLDLGYNEDAILTAYAAKEWDDDDNDDDDDDISKEENVDPELNGGGKYKKAGKTGPPFTDKDDRQHDHIKDSEKDRGKSEEEAESIAWATVNKQKKKADTDDLLEKIVQEALGGLNFNPGQSLTPSSMNPARREEIVQTPTKKKIQQRDQQKENYPDEYNANVTVQHPRYTGPEQRIDPATKRKTKYDQSGLTPNNLSRLYPNLYPETQQAPQAAPAQEAPVSASNPYNYMSQTPQERGIYGPDPSVAGTPKWTGKRSQNPDPYAYDKKPPAPTSNWTGKRSENPNPYAYDKQESGPFEGFNDSPVGKFTQHVKDYFGGKGKPQAPGATAPTPSVPSEQGSSKMDGFVNWLKGIHTKMKNTVNNNFGDLSDSDAGLDMSKLPKSYTDPSFGTTPNSRMANQTADKLSVSAAFQTMTLVKTALANDSDDFDLILEALNAEGYNLDTIVLAAEMTAKHHHKSATCPRCGGIGSYYPGGGYYGGGYFGCSNCGFENHEGSENGNESHDADDSSSTDSDAGTTDSDAGGDAGGGDGGGDGGGS